MTAYRIDKDSLGEVQVPIDAYYGPFSVRASAQYNVTGHASHENVIKAFVMIKKAAALANKELGVLDKEKSDAIIRACEDVLSGALKDQFIIDAINSGAGTALHMNVNEVLANRALEILGHKKGEYDLVSPNDHVNMSQSSNDTFPTAMHIAILLSTHEVKSALLGLISSLENKKNEFNDVIKIGRTHMMDALPVTLGDEFSEYAFSMQKGLGKVIQSSLDLEYVAVGGTAVGTGANAPGGYRDLVIKFLSQLSGFELKPSKNAFFSLQSKFEIATFSSSLRNLAIELMKMANDTRLMASGPTAGLAEILIPTVHAGSSIMPGKVNPSLSECLNMICFNIIGNDVSVVMAAQAGQFELNVMLPVMVKCVLESTDMLSNFLPIFARNMIEGIKANEHRLASYVEKSPILVTLLNPYIGYSKASEIYKESLATKKSIRELVLEKGLMTSSELNKVLAKENILGANR